MILCWSRWRRWWFTTSQDREHTFEGVVGFLDAVGGAPRIARTDRMGALGVSQGRRFTLHPPTLGFARHYGLVVQPCQAGDAKRKGKVERPFRQLREGFLAEQQLAPPANLEQLNDRAAAWLDPSGARRGAPGDPGGAEPAAGDRAGACWCRCLQSGSTPRSDSRDGCTPRSR